MHHLLSTSTALSALSNNPTKKLFRLSQGQYTGRIVALYQSSPTEINLQFTDPPYTNWAAAITVANDSADSAFDVCLAPDGTLWVAYTNSSNALITRKLTFSGGTWLVASPVTAYGAEQSEFPSIVRDPFGTLWISWSRLVTPNRYVQVKSSTDNGATWGTGPADTGETVTTPTTFAFSKLLVRANQLYLVASQTNTKLIFRARPFGAGSWSDETAIATSAAGFGEHFDSALGTDGILGVVWSDSALRFREFDGLAWGAVATISSQPQISPQLLYRSNYPIILWPENFAGLQRKIVYTERSTGIFSTPATLDPGHKEFDSVLLYNQFAATYQNVTTAAGSITPGDIIHPASGCMLKQIGDALYIGMDVRFCYLHLQLSTPGAGGTVSYNYFDGSTWKPFTPSSGVSHLDASELRIHLWQDYQSVPSDWQKKTIAGQTRFWVKCEVTSAYTTGPVGSRLTAIPETVQLIVRR